MKQGPGSDVKGQREAGAPVAGGPWRAIVSGSSEATVTLTKVTHKVHN